MCSITWRHFQWPWVTLTRVSRSRDTYKSNISKTVRFRDTCSYQRALIGNHTRSTEWYNFQWPWVTSDPDFKVTTFFDIEYLRNDTRYSHSYYRTSTGSHMCSITWRHFQWLWVTPNPGFKVTVYLDVEYLKTVRFRDKVTKEHW